MFYDVFLSYVLYCNALQKNINGHKCRECLACKALYARRWRRTSLGIESTRIQSDLLQYSTQEDAKKKVYIAVRSGDLPRVNTLLCVDCGVRAQCYDHRDYLKPLDVSPVCRKCNAKRGKALNHE